VFARKIGLISQKATWPRHPLRPVALGGPDAFIDDGRIELDNNTVERSIRPIALTVRTRCSRVPTGGRRSTGPRRRPDRDLQVRHRPARYLTDALTRSLNGHPNRISTQFAAVGPIERQELKAWPRTALT